jgi:prepilin-type N-terminal cleavage/methylation domain-containing protein/prepilin-type processing-associated H-X9-DG protein
MGKRKAFTLIELLVVIAVIALLMSILMPALSRAKKQARNVACRATLKQWGPIWFMYCSDNDGSFPSGNDDVNWTRGEWIIALRSLYETRSEILRCPMATRRLPSGENQGGPFNTYVMGTGGTGNLQEECSYGQNNWLFNPPTGAGVIQGRDPAWYWRNTNVKGNLNNIPVFADTMWRGGAPSYKDSNRIDPPQFNGQWLNAGHEMKHFCVDRHSGSVNHLFLDWSVRPVGIKELWTLRWHRQFDTRGRWTLAGGVSPADWPEWMRSFKDY